MTNSMSTILRIELEGELFPNGMNTEQIKIMDRVEDSFKKAFKSGFTMGKMIGGEEWSNNACLGYLIIGAQRLGYTENQITEIVRATNGQFDFSTIDEARQVYESSPY